MESSQTTASGMPVSLRYNISSQPGVAASRSLVKFQPDNASVFTPTNGIVRISVTSAQFLELDKAVLDLDFTNVGATDNNYLDSGIGGIFQRVRILSLSGNELERIDNYAMLNSIFDQYASSGLGQLCKEDILAGAPGKLDMSPYMPVSGTTAADSTTSNGFNLVIAGGGTSIMQNLAGGQMYQQNQATRLETGVMRHFSFRFKALGFFNSMKMLPPNSPFQLELTLAPSIQALTRVSGSANQDYSVSNFWLSVPAVTLRDPSVMMALSQKLSEGISTYCVSFENKVNTTAGSAGSDVLQLACRAKELRGIITAFRVQSNIGNANAFQNSKRSIQPISDYQYQIGSDLYPQSAVTLSTDVTAGGTASGTRIALKSKTSLNVSSAYHEVVRLFSSLSKTGECTPLIGLENYAQSENILNSGCGIIAVDLSSYTDASVSSGINTSAQSLQTALRITKTAAANATLQVDSFAVIGMRVLRSPSGDMSVLK